MRIMRVCIAGSLFDGEGNGGATHQAAAGSRYRDGVGLLGLREVTSCSATHDAAQNRDG